ncbi:MAG: cytochrome o ubiquinol oxidase subunit III [Coxiellaceae bacterium]|nr:cytochrome o ubiquinol oxidase subunit III [Coxiellaceae bacterium]
MSTEPLALESTNAESVDVFGFWMYIMTDCILFASLFAAFAVLHNNTFGGPSLKQLVSLPYVFVESMFLLFSNLTYGMALLRLYNKKTKKMVFWLILSMILGAGFLGMELYEFADLVHEGHSWQSSAGMSSFFTLVGTHGLHVFFGLLWMIILTIQLATFGTNSHMRRRFTYLGLFWNFLDIVWIFVFTIVYLMGAI